MPNYNVTGKLGGGKTLWAVTKAFEALDKGLKVASNVDLFPEKILRPWRTQTSVRLMRLPDYPTRDDMDLLGVGNDTSDEGKNGLLILDECGVLFNARNYKEAGRQDLVNWFLHARKLGWDVMFISQSSAMIDKQIRDALVEYLVICKRFDRYNVPFLPWIGIKIKLPRIHFAIIKYGSTPGSMVADRDFFRGKGVFDAYSTRQLINGQVLGVYSVLSPWHLKGRYMSPTQLAKFAAKSAWVSGVVLGCLSTWIYYNASGYEKPVKSAIAEIAKLPLATGVINQPDGSFVVIKPDGQMEVTRTIKYSKDGDVATLSTGSFRLPKANP
jgi:Zonular occludens toxin (Zot)